MVEEHAGDSNFTSVDPYMAIIDFTIDSKIRIREALLKIDANKKGFLIVLDGSSVVGTLTDGDIRRAFIRGYDFDDTLMDIYTSPFHFLTLNDTFAAVINYFKDSKVKFLPILDDAMQLCNIITKQNMHALLLQNIAYDPLYPFCDMDESLLDHEIYPRPWGFYKTAFLNQFCQCKTITVNPKSSLSLQKHLRREEHWIIVHGEGSARVADEVFTVKAGCHIHIPRETLHRLMNNSEKEALIVTEVQLGDYFGEDDIIRIEDEYGRS